MTGERGQATIELVAFAGVAAMVAVGLQAVLVAWAAQGRVQGIAASLLQRMGRDVVHIDDSWDRVRELAIRTTPVAAA